MKKVRIKAIFLLLVLLVTSFGISYTDAKKEIPTLYLVVQDSPTSFETAQIVKQGLEEDWILCPVAGRCAHCVRREG